MSAYSLITGATGGLGKSFAEELARMGKNLILVARNQEVLTSMADALHDRYLVDVQTIAVDLSHKDSVSTITKVLSELGVSIDLLINNAGFGDTSAFLQSKLDRQLEMIDVNVRALTELTHRMQDFFAADEPCYILNVASIAAFMPGPYMSVYFASKAYVKSFSEALYQELKDTNIQVSCLCPGPVSTGFEKASRLQDSPMFKLMKPSEAPDIARAGLAGLFAGRKTIVAPKRFGVLKLCAVVPQKLLLHAVEKVTKPTHQ